MKLLKHKKSALFVIPVFVWITLMVVFLGLPLGGFIKFLFADKTIYIVIGGLILLFLLKERKRR